MKCEIAISLQGKQTWQFPLPESGPTIKALAQIHVYVYGYTNGHIYVTFRTAVFKYLDGGNTSKFNVSFVFLSFLSNIFIVFIFIQYILHWGLIVPYQLSPISPCSESVHKDCFFLSMLRSMYIV